MRRVSIDETCRPLDGRSVFHTWVTERRPGWGQSGHTPSIAKVCKLFCGTGVFSTRNAPGPRLCEP